MYTPSPARKRRQLPLAIRLAMAALFAAIIALGASFALRDMNL